MIYLKLTLNVCSISYFIIHQGRMCGTSYYVVPYVISFSDRSSDDNDNPTPYLCPSRQAKQFNILGLRAT